MSKRKCEAKVEAHCPHHGVKALTVLMQQSILEENATKYFEYRTKIRELNESLVGTRPRDAVHPVLVYGTLRPRGANYGRFIKGYSTDEEEVELEGFTMYEGPGFPFLTKGEGKVTATLTYFDDSSYREVIKNLDMLESFHDDDDPNNGYDRVLQTVHIGGKPVTAWIYVASEGVAHYAKQTLKIVASGDWIDHAGPRDVQY